MNKCIGNIDQVEGSGFRRRLCDLKPEGFHPPWLILLFATFSFTLIFFTSQ